MDAPKKKKSTYRKPKPETTFSHGRITANVYRKSTGTGFEYRDFELVRIFEQANGKQNHFRDYFAEDAEDVARAARDAAEYILQKGTTKAAA